MNSKALRILLVWVLTITGTACARLHPNVIQATATDYNRAMQQSRDEQMLLNLVRLKYRDTPYFLETGSVSSQLVLSTDASLSASFREQQIPESVGLGAGITFKEQPTITFSPLQGDEFVERLLTPISIDTLLLMVNSGWSVSRVFRLCVEQINQFANAANASGPTPESAPDFQSFLDLTGKLRELQKRLLIRFGDRVHGDKKQAVMKIVDGAGADGTLADLRAQLGLNPSLSEYPLLPGSGAVANSGALVLNTRSLLGVMFYLSHSVQAPAADSRAGRVTTTRDASGAAFDWSRLTEDLFTVLSSGEEPEQAAVKTFYRGAWFYVDDRALDTKSTFTLLTQLFSLQAGAVEGLTPVLTLPVGQ